MIILPEWESKDEASPQFVNWPPSAGVANCVRDQRTVLSSSFSLTAALTRLGASLLCVDDLEPFANNQHRLVERSTLKVITAKVVLVSYSPIRQRSISFTFFKGELLRNFIEGKNDDTKGFDHQHRVTAPIQHDRKIPFLWERCFIFFVAHQCRARRVFDALSHECGQLIGQLFLNPRS